jgi:rRNA-processing protein FCF1
MYRVIVDTSFIISAVKYKIDVRMCLIPIIDGPFEIIVPSPVISELKYISKNRGKRGRDATIGLKILEQLKPVIESTKSSLADEAVAEVAEIMEDAIIATNDAKLKNSLKRKGRKVFSVKGAAFIGQA